ncbi:MAG: LysM peptidoglycan-binding domain-containing protein [Prevotella sp.]|nr:LysM peptidoglycan-binding domain-containing protein [Prevotella sp.]
MKSNLKRCLMALAFVLVSALSFAQTRVINHIVAEGETLESIAQRYNTSVETITAINPDAAQTIYVGMEVKIPVTIVESGTETVTTQPNNTNTTVQTVNTGVYDDSFTKWDVAYRLAVGYLTKPSGIDYQFAIGAKYSPIQQLYIALMAGYLGAYQFKSDTFTSHLVTIPIEIGGHFKLHNGHYISPYLGFDFNICVKTTYNFDDDGMSSDMKKKMKEWYKDMEKDLQGKLCADFRLGVKYGLNSNCALGISMVVPMNDNEKGLLSSNIYPEICLSTCF